ncbi:hypothetical protein ACLOJK_031586 [Asimina triloba]
MKPCTYTVCSAPPEHGAPVWCSIVFPNPAHLPSPSTTSRIPPPICISFNPPTPSPPANVHDPTSSRTPVRQPANEIHRPDPASRRHNQRSLLLRCKPAPPATAHHAHAPSARSQATVQRLTPKSPSSSHFPHPTLVHSLATPVSPICSTPLQPHDASMPNRLQTQLPITDPVADPASGGESQPSDPPAPSADEHPDLDGDTSPWPTIPRASSIHGSSSHLQPRTPSAAAGDAPWPAMPEPITTPATPLPCVAADSTSLPQSPMPASSPCPEPTATIDPSRTRWPHTHHGCHLSIRLHSINPSAAHIRFKAGEVESLGRLARRRLSRTFNN